MLIKNMDAKVYHPGNNFYDTLVSDNKFFQDTLRENRDERKKISTFRIGRPTTTTNLNSSVKTSHFSPPLNSISNGKASQRAIKSNRDGNANKSSSEREVKAF